jgi:hypothetical protein
MWGTGLTTRDGRVEPLAGEAEEAVEEVAKI